MHVRALRGGDRLFPSGGRAPHPADRAGQDHQPARRACRGRLGGEARSDNRVETCYILHITCSSAIV